MPGMINTHCHAAMTFLRGVAEDVSIADWFNDYIWPMEVNVGRRATCTSERWLPLLR